MTSKKFKDQCSDLTREFQIKIPCKLAERVESYVEENNTDFTVVVIEALDTFLRHQKTRQKTSHGL